MDFSEQFLLRPIKAHYNEKRGKLQELQGIRSRPARQPPSSFVAFSRLRIFSPIRGETGSKRAFSSLVFISPISVADHRPMRYN